MNHKAKLAGLFTSSILLLSAAMGCANSAGSLPSSDARAAQAAGRSDMHTFQKTAQNAEVQSRVTRETSQDGVESLVAHTSFRCGSDPHPVVLDERATIDPMGRLIRARFTLSSGPAGATALRSVDVDAASGTVLISDVDGNSTIKVPTTEAWILTSVMADLLPELGGATPLQGWIAARAASSGLWLREVNVGHREHHRTPTSQVVFTVDEGRWIVLGDEVVEADDTFITSVPWRALDASDIARAPRTPDGAHGPA